MVVSLSSTSSPAPYLPLVTQATLIVILVLWLRLVEGVGIKCQVVVTQACPE